MALKGQEELPAQGKIPATSNNNVRKDLKDFWEWLDFGPNIHRS